MLYYIDKLLTQLIYPLHSALLVALFAWLLLWVGWRRLGMYLLGLAIAWLWLWSLPVVSDSIRLSLENKFPNKAVSELPVVDAVVLLGGSVNPAPMNWPYADLSASSDRVVHAARIYHAGKASVVIISGGNAPWEATKQPEASSIKQLIGEFGVPSQLVVLESESQTTRENAVRTELLLRKLGIKQVLLVTSALHMRRALATFRIAGVEAIPAPTDFEVMPERSHLLRWLPDAEALEGSTRAIKEYLGWLVYRWRGWL